MSELQVIENALQRTAKRRRWQGAWRGFWTGLLAGAAVWLVVLAFYKVLPVPQLALGIVAGLVLMLTLLGAVVGGWRKPTLLQTARWVDDQQHFQERLSTALEVVQDPRSGRWRELLLADAANRVREVDARRLLPWRLPRLARWTVVVLVLAAGLGFVPEYRSQAHRQRQREAEVMKEAGRQLVELTKRQLENRPPVLEPTQKALEAVQELGRELGKAQLTRQQALKDLASATDRIKDQLKELGKNPGLRKLDQGMRSSPTGQAMSAEAIQKKIEDLQEQLGKQAAQAEALQQMRRDLQSIKEAAAAMNTGDPAAAQAMKSQLSGAMAELAKKAEELGVDLEGMEEAIKALADGKIDQLLKDLDLASIDLEKLAQMAKAMKDLQAQLMEIGKTLAEQLEKGQGLPALANLNKMIRQLKEVNLSPEQLQKLLQEVDDAVKPGSEYGKVGDFLKDAVKELQQGKKSEGAQSLAQAADELKKLMEQMGDCEGLMASLDGLRTAQMCVGNGMFWGMCKGAACRPGFRPGGRPGRGVGTWGDDGLFMDPEDTGLWDNSGVERPDQVARGLTDRGEGQLNPALLPTKVKGKISPGGQMPSITIRGLSIKGESKVQYEERVTAAQSEAQSALSQDQVPRAYRGAVRDYFDDLK